MIYIFKAKPVIIRILFFLTVFILGLIWKMTGFDGIADTFAAK